MGYIWIGIVLILLIIAYSMFGPKKSKNATSTSSDAEVHQIMHIPTDSLPTAYKSQKPLWQQFVSDAASAQSGM